jgi:MarR-like DNA-binding transcriptional regulator SgrR of sgrS sRNA
MSTITENDLLAALTEAYSLPFVDAARDVTAEMLAVQLKVSQRHASNILRAEEQAGRLVSHAARNAQGRTVKAYRKV